MSSFLARGTSQVDRSLRDVVSHRSVSTHTVSRNGHGGCHGNRFVRWHA